MNSRFGNKEHENRAPHYLGKNQKYQRGHIDKSCYAVPGNPDLPEFGKLLDHFNMSASTPFDEILLDIMRCLSTKRRITENQEIWLLNQSNQSFFNSSLQKAYHVAIATEELANFAASNDPLCVIRAAHHFNEAKMAAEAHRLLLEHSKLAENKNLYIVAFYHLRNAKALCELRLFVEAKAAVDLSYAAHKEEIQTLLLLGALSLHLNEFDDALKWYKEARKFNGKVFSGEIQSDMKNILKNFPAALRHQAVKKFLACDYEQYKFLRGVLPKKMKNV